jgi:hypothetical protein
MWLLLPWWTSKFVWILHKGKGEEARLDATSSNHLHSVQTKRCQQFSFGLTFWGLFTQCYSDMWAHVLRILWNVSYCWVELAIMGSAIMWEAVACFHQSPSHLSFSISKTFHHHFQPGLNWRYLFRSTLN